MRFKLSFTLIVHSGTLVTQDKNHQSRRVVFNVSSKHPINGSLVLNFGCLKKYFYIYMALIIYSI